MKQLLVILCAAAMLVALVAVPGEADAKKKRSRSKPNMPVGWSWPPNKAMIADGDDCLKQLDALGVQWQAAKKQRKIATPVVVPSMTFGGVVMHSIFRKGPFPMDCHLALALETSAGPALRSIGIKQINFFGIYQYRNVNGAKHGSLSRHALGLAFDVGSFETDDGTVHTVKTDYKKEDSVLLTTEALINATGAFRLLLTPGNDPKHHYDHFHFEARTPRDKHIDYKAREKAKKAKSRRS